MLQIEQEEKKLHHIFHPMDKRCEFRVKNVIYKAVQQFSRILNSRDLTNFKNLQAVLNEASFQQAPDNCYIECIVELAAALEKEYKQNAIIIIDGAEEPFLAHRFHYVNKDFKFLTAFLKATFNGISVFQFCLMTSVINIFHEMKLSDKIRTHDLLPSSLNIDEFYEINGEELKTILTDYSEHEPNLINWYQINRSLNDETIEDNKIKFNPNSVLNFAKSMEAKEKEGPNETCEFKIHSRGSCFMDYLSQAFISLKSTLANISSSDQLQFETLPNVSLEHIRSLIFSEHIDKSIFFTILLKENFISYCQSSKNYIISNQESVAEIKRRTIYDPSIAPEFESLRENIIEEFRSLFSDTNLIEEFQPRKSLDVALHEYLRSFPLFINFAEALKRTLPINKLHAMNSNEAFFQSTLIGLVSKASNFRFESLEKDYDKRRADIIMIDEQLKGITIECKYEDFGLCNQASLQEPNYQKVIKIYQPKTMILLAITFFDNKYSTSLVKLKNITF
jgi:hypothetical protein